MPFSGTVSEFLNSAQTLAATSFTISDSSVNIALNIDSLKNNLSKISSIALTDAPTPVPAPINVTGPNPAPVAVPNAVPPPPVAVPPPAPDPALVAPPPAPAPAPAPVVPTPTTYAIISISATQALNDISVISKIISPSSCRLNISNIRANQVSLISNAYFGIPNIAIDYSIVDTSSNLSANLDAIQSALFKGDRSVWGFSFYVSDNNPLLLTSDQATNDSSILSATWIPCSISFAGQYSNYLISPLYNGKNNSFSGFSLKDNVGVNKTTTINSNVQFLYFNSGETSVKIQNTSATQLACSGESNLIVFDQTASAKITAGSGNDIIFAGPNATIYGGKGVTTVAFNSSSSNFIITPIYKDDINKQLTGYSIADQTGTRGSTVIDSSVKYLNFSGAGNGASTAVLSISANNLTTTLNNSNNSFVSLYDSAANLVTIIDSLQSNISKILSIVVSDNVAVSLTSSKVSLDIDALILIIKNGGKYIVKGWIDTPNAIATNYLGDGMSTVIIKNTSSGKMYFWDYGNGLNTKPFDVSIDSNWQIIGNGNFILDGKSQILWRNNSTGQIALWESGWGNNYQPLGSSLDPNWKIIGTGDFTGDGQSDILWKNSSSGIVALWVDGNASKVLTITTIDDSITQIVGIGNLNGKSKSDILFRNSSTGLLSSWELVGNSIDSKLLGVISDLNWNINSLGDFDGDGISDILWQNKATGVVTLWVDGNSLNQQYLGTVLDKNWNIIGTGDYFGDGKFDILWQNTSTGTLSIWLDGSSAKILIVGTISDPNLKII